MSEVLADELADADARGDDLALGQVSVVLRRQLTIDAFQLFTEVD